VPVSRELCSKQRCPINYPCPPKGVWTDSSVRTLLGRLDQRDFKPVESPSNPQNPMGRLLGAFVRLGYNLGNLVWAIHEVA